ncbi:hypothetical protein AS73P1_00038 [Alistipes phage AS73P1]|nr:hypothetical protein AS73P1_00038 [Alistipes phage AS73P1]
MNLVPGKRPVVWGIVPRCERKGKNKFLYTKRIIFYFSVLSK